MATKSKPVKRVQQLEADKVVAPLNAKEQRVYRLWCLENAVKSEGTAVGIVNRAKAYYDFVVGPQ